MTEREAAEAMREAAAKVADSEREEAKKNIATPFALIAITTARDIARDIRALPLPDPPPGARDALIGTNVSDAAIAEAQAREGSGTIATVKRSPAGPYLLIAGIETRSWLGTNHDDGAEKLAADINAALAARDCAKDATIARLCAQLEAAESQLYVPGRWRCPKCNFGLTQMRMRAADGAVGARDDPGEKCPNCATPLWRVTEREAGDELAERCQEQMQRAIKAEAQVEVAREVFFRFYESCPHWGRCHRFMPDEFSCSLVENDKCVCKLIRAAIINLSEGA